jgi:hypothetical protein
MTTTIVDPTLQFFNLLVANWIPGNTAGVTPSFQSGWYDTKNPNPQIAVPFDGHSESLSTESGYNAMTPAGPSQFPFGTVLVVGFAHDEMTGLPANGPKDMAWLLCREAQRIVHAAASAMADFEHVSPGGLIKVVDREISPVLYMVQFLAGYSRFEDP